MHLRVVSHAGAGAFLERARAWLMACEAEHNLLLGTALEEAASGSPVPDALFVTVEEEDVVGAALRMPPRRLTVTEMPLAAVPALMEIVARRYQELPGVRGPKPVAQAAAEEWTRLRGGSWAAGQEQREYRLEAVRAPAPVPGSPRLARPGEEELVKRWMEAFRADAGARFGVAADTVRRWVGRGDIWLWEDGAPVCMARCGGATPGGVRVGHVYTPPDRRRRGYATALVAAVSQAALDGGASFCVLHTDQSNPTSNRIYRKIGYEPLLDTADAEIIPE